MLYDSMTSNQRSDPPYVRRDLSNNTGNLLPQSGVYPDYFAPIVRNSAVRPVELVVARWGMPLAPKISGRKEDRSRCHQHPQSVLAALAADG